MRFVLFLLGLVLGVAATLGYVVFIESDGQRHAQTRDALEPDAPVTIILGEPFLNGLVRHIVVDSAAGDAMDPSAVAVHLRDGTIVLAADVDVLGQRTRGTARLRPMIENGELRLDVIDTFLGRLPLPPMDRAIEQQLNARLHSMFEDMPVRVTGARVDQTRGLILTCEIDLARIARVDAWRAL